MLHYVQEVSYFKNLQVLGEWSVVPTNKCSSERKAALLPRSYVEKVGQCTWGKNLLLLCSHPSNSVLIVSMNTFKLVAVFSPLLQMSPTNMPRPLPRFWFLKSPLRGEKVSMKLFWIVVLHTTSPPKTSIGLLKVTGSFVLSPLVFTALVFKFAPVMSHSSPNWCVRCLDCIQFFFVPLHMNKWWVSDSFIVLHADYCDLLRQTWIAGLNPSLSLFL